MNILVAKNGSQLGPFSETDLRAKLAAGEFAPTDYGWHEGLTAWSPLSQLLGSAPAPMVPSPAPSVPTQPYAAPQGQAAPGGYAPQPASSPYPAAYQPGSVQAWGTPGTGSYAGFWLRFVALIIDVIAGYIIGFVIGLVLGIILGIMGGVGQDVLAVISGIVGLVINWLYYAVMEASPTQGTFGKMAIGLKVTDLNGGRIGFGQATGRFFGKFVSAIIVCIGFMMAGFTERKQALHDMMASTLVVRK